MFKKRKLARKLASIGSHVESVYMVYLNNNEPLSFSSKSDLTSYVEHFREENVIFKLQIYRIETYSL